MGGGEGECRRCLTIFGDGGCRTGGGVWGSSSFGEARGESLAKCFLELDGDDPRVS